jgi:hypothetical protein
MKAWGFFRGEGRLPSESELAGARRHVGGAHVTLDPGSRTIAFDEAGVELDLGGIAKGYAVDRVVELLERRDVAAALISAGGSTIYGFGSPPGAAAWTVTLQDPIDSRKTAFTNRVEGPGGVSRRRLGEGVRDGRHPLLAHHGSADGAARARRAERRGAHDNGHRRRCARQRVFRAGTGAEPARISVGLHDTEVIFFMPDARRGWTVVRAQ